MQTQQNFASVSTTPAQKFASGEWMHLFGAGGVETQCRIVIDLVNAKMIAAQEWSGLKYQDIHTERFDDLADSVLNVNEAHIRFEDYDLTLTNHLPDWSFVALREQLYMEGFYAGDRIDRVSTDVPGKFVVFDSKTSDGFAIVGDDIRALVYEAHSHVFAANDAKPEAPTLGASVQGICEVNMLEVVGDYDTPDEVPEWGWIEANASFVHAENRASDAWEFIINLSRDFYDIPDKLAPVFEAARAKNCSYVIFHQGF